MPTNPDKYIRAAYISLLNGIGIPVYSNMVPKDKQPITKYVLMSTQTKTQSNISKPTAANIEQHSPHDWESYITLQIFNWNIKGYSNQVVVDDIAEIIITRLETIGLSVQNFHVQYTKVESSNYQLEDNETNSVDCINIIIRHTLCFR